MLDVVEAIDGTERAFRCRRFAAAVRPANPTRRYTVPCGIHRVMTNADRVWRASLGAVTIADLVETVARDAPPAGLVAGAEWIREVLT